jgi:hypothetical protein
MYLTSSRLVNPKNHNISSNSSVNSYSEGRWNQSDTADQLKVIKTYLANEQTETFESERGVGCGVRRSGFFNQHQTETKNSQSANKNVRGLEISAKKPARLGHKPQFSATKCESLKIHNTLQGTSYVGYFKNNKITSRSPYCLRFLTVI